MALLSVITSGAKEIKRDFDAELKLFAGEQRKKMRLAGNFLRRQVRREAGTKFRRITGTLQRSISFGMTKPSGPVLEGKVFLRRGYYSILETGGVIRPKNRTEAQVAKRTKKGLYTARPGRGYLAFQVGGVRTSVTGGGKRFRFLSGGSWARVPEVHIPARPFMAPVATKDGPAAAQIVGDAFGVFTGGRRAA